MNFPKEGIIIGGGSSLKEGIEKGLWEKIKNHFSIGTNYSYKFFDSTLQVFVDSSFYNAQKIELERLPLIIGQCRNIKVKLPNTLSIPANHIYTRDLTGGIHSAKLSGIYALTLMIHLLSTGNLYLLGFDNGAITKDLDSKKRKITHWYQGQTEHRGVGKVSYYDTKDRGDKDFGCFKNENKVKIWNVSPLSKINVFEKIDYTTFFQKLNPEIFNQDELREYIKTKLQGKYK